MLNIFFASICTIVEIAGEYVYFLDFVSLLSVRFLCIFAYDSPWILMISIMLLEIRIFYWKSEMLPSSGPQPIFQPNAMFPLPG